jgi:tRNA nucleotidyltransferase (CCA-adding enzyme)
MLIKEVIRERLRKLLTENRIQFHMEIPSDIISINEVFKQNGYDLYLVGGCVRDALQNKTPKDFDLVTNATPDSVEQIMQESGYKTLPTGKQFGIINVLTDSDEYEIATFRKDQYQSNGTGDGRRPDSVTFSDLESDCKRRDLTVNALYYNISTHEIIDLVDGIEDIKNGVIRTVGRPEDRFKEDKLRILRAIRFSGRFGSELDPEIDRALKNDASLNGISGERIRDEFIKCIKSAKLVKKLLLTLDKYHLFNWIFKGLIVNKNFIECKDPVVLIAHLLKNNDVNLLGKQLNNLKYSFSEVKAITFLINLLDLTPETSVTLKKQQKNSYTTDEQIIEFAKFEYLPTHLVKTFLQFQLSVTGDEVMQKYKLKGKELGEMITKLEIDNFKKSL